MQDFNNKNQTKTQFPETTKYVSKIYTEAQSKTKYFGNKWFKKMSQKTQV